MGGSIPLPLLSRRAQGRVQIRYRHPFPRLSALPDAIRSAAPHMTPSYSSKCRRCRYARVYGNARITAEAKSVSHALRMGHVIDVTITDMEKLSSELHATYGERDPDQEGIPF